MTYKTKGKIQKLVLGFDELGSFSVVLRYDNGIVCVFGH